MEIYQKRSSRLRKFLVNLLFIFFFVGVGLLILSMWLTSIQMNYPIKKSWILVVPIIFFAILGIISFMNLRIHRKYLKVKNPLLTITKKGLTPFDIRNGNVFIPWNQIGEIEYKRMGKLIRVKNKENRLLANILIPMLAAKPNDVLKEIEKYKQVKRIW
jgi:hypothetical protein